MKDRVFLAWSGNNEVAKKVATRLESEGYQCCVGGNDDNSSKNLSICDSVITQVKKCHQAIIIFQNKTDENGNRFVSQNLFIEFGYVLMAYGPQKIHCVKRKNEEAELPSDVENSDLKN